MSTRRFLLLVLLCLLALAAPVDRIAAGSGGGAVTHIDVEAGICYWQCNDGSVGSAPATPPLGKNCRNLCAAACGGPCIALY